MFAQDQVALLPPPAVPVPLEPPVRELRGESHADLIDPLIELAREIGYTVTFDDSPRGDGYCHTGQRRIAIAQGLEPNARLATLIHELGHALLAQDNDAPGLAYAQEELVVESIAFIICSGLGVATDGESVPYIAGWGEEAGWGARPGGQAR